ncbi:spoIIIJ-associated protein [Gracilibacillus halotolerans]|uniref:RNA-binding protein KhpB n=1 Tax=Gracilibacillus halotolerans TaxID=74386 RepID=A0A841RS31_9BACI|nr:spoIIIJ-associated protein [Gracilibacillus halotolerans]
MRTVTATGESVQDAVQSALKQLNITEDQATIQIIDEGKRGLFGLFGAKPAIVKVSQQTAPKESEQVNKEIEVIEPTIGESKAFDKIDPVEKVEAYIRSITSSFDKEIKVSTKVESNVVVYDLSGEKIAMLIGKRGQTLNAIQYLAQLAMHQYADKYFTVIVDAEGYRERRKETLEQLAKRAADRAIKTRKNVKLDPMPSFERKIIHTVLHQDNRIETESNGSEPNRYLVIKPK